LYFTAFPTTYLVGSGVSWVTYLVSEVCYCPHIVKRANLRVSLTTPQSDIQKLASVHQVQGIHRI
jgi:hypothetical protein